MDIWILVLALLVLAIIVLVMSLFTKDSTGNASLNKKLEDHAEKIRQLQHSINQLKVEDTSIESVEEEFMQPLTAQDVYFAPKEDAEEFEAIEAVEEHEALEVAEEVVQPRVNYDVNDRNREDIIRYYSQGYTLKEIEDEVDEELVTIQYVIDEYIENR
ncbi:terminase gpP N-terminus-related DNA-binding protein [Facklamia sp. P12945]|uniref:terminase gpP N-terminus-related DNA-binding protein n=1 Tax=unclassified Facklamia TaxID=2622293 RepID=UPI003D1658E3